MKKTDRFRHVMAIVAILALIAALMTGCGRKNDEDALIVGMELKYPPFETVDAEGKPAGVSVDIANALGEYLDRPVVIENMAFNGLIASLQTGKIDLIISSMTIRDDRKETIDFSEPYTRINLALLIAKDSPVNSKADLNSDDVTIAVKTGTSGYLFATENYPLAKIEVFDETATCILEVVQGKSDVFIYDQMSIFEAGAKNPETTRTNLEPLSETPESWGIGIRKGEEELLAEINAFIETSRQNGFFNELGDEYLSSMKAEFDQRGIPFFFD
jgi:polar amino acid transport system substrate-binding protein